MSYIQLKSEKHNKNKEKIKCELKKSTEQNLKKSKMLEPSNRDFKITTLIMLKDRVESI